MLRTPAPFPHVGSFGLFTDTSLPVAQQRAELARILERGVNSALIALPLRLGAAGNQRVALADVIDATPLTKLEERELTDLERALRGRARPNPTKATRLNVLRERAIWSLVLNSELAKLHSLAARKHAA